MSPDLKNSKTKNACQVIQPWLFDLSPPPPPTLGVRPVLSGEDGNPVLSWVVCPHCPRGYPLSCPGEAIPCPDAGTPVLDWGTAQPDRGTPVKDLGPGKGTGTGDHGLPPSPPPPQKRSGTGDHEVPPCWRTDTFLQIDSCEHFYHYKALFTRKVRVRFSLIFAILLKC